MGNLYDELVEHGEDAVYDSEGDMTVSQNAEWYELGHEIKAARKLRKSVISFADWDDTPQGHDYWAGVYNNVADRVASLEAQQRALTTSNTQEL